MLEGLKKIEEECQAAPPRSIEHHASICRRLSLPPDLARGSKEHRWPSPTEPNVKTRRRGHLKLTKLLQSPPKSLRCLHKEHK